MKKRCLMFYPWNLNEQSGSQALFLSYSRALKREGFLLDCYAPRAESFLSDGVFDNFFSAPDRQSPLTPHLEVAGSQWEDHRLPEKLGRDEAAMAAAGVLASVSNYDVVGIQYTRCHSLGQMLQPGMPAVMFTHDLDSLVARQEEVLFGTPAEYRLEDEVSRLKPFNLVTVVGPEDRQALQSIEPGMPIVEAPFTSAVANGVTIREHSSGVLLWISSAAPFHRFSFVWFWKNVWPKILAARPECRLVIAGRISEVADQLGAGADPRVSLLGVVDDADSLYRNADVLIAPYYFGLGIKTKVIEALGKGVPVATTTLGIYNTHIQPGRDAVVSDDASEYADQVIKLIAAPLFRSELAHNGREYVRKWHDPQTALRPFVEAFHRVADAKTTSPKSRPGAVWHLREPLRHRIPPVIERCLNDGVKTVAIYGAGSHTQLLIPIWEELGGPAIKQIVVTKEPAETTCVGVPIVSSQEFNSASVDAIVLSSQGSEDEMAGVCRKHWPEMKIYPIWRRVGEALCQETIPKALYVFSRGTAQECSPGQASGSERCPGFNVTRRTKRRQVRKSLSPRCGL
jgi:hypothetical protein